MVHFPQFDSLRTAVEWSIRELKVPRDNRVRAVKQYVGGNYARGGADKRVPINLLELATTIYVQNLAANAPRVQVTTGVDELKPFARNMQLALNQVPDEIGLTDTLQRVVKEALFGIGVCKVGLCSSGVCVLGHDAGKPFVDVVPLDDYFLDMSAKTRSGIQFEGNDYWLGIEAARALYDGEDSDVKADDHTVHGDQGEARAEGITTSEGAGLYGKRVWLRDVWLPGERKVLTYGVKSHKLFRVVDWDGPEHGPYYTLSYSDVPGNLLPLPPASLWLDLHDLANVLFRKLARQAEAKKTVALFPGGNDADAEALKGARDGEGMTYTGQKPEEVSLGGIDQATLALVLQIKDMSSYLAGNLDALGGLAPMSETVGQDRLLAEGASARTDSYKSNTLAFVKDLFEALAFYEWTDPVRERAIEKKADDGVGGSFVLKRVWSKETREGDWLDYNFDIDPYSMEPNTPASRLQKISQALERFVIPLLPQLQQQGGQVNVSKLLEIVAKLSNVDELREIVQFTEPIPGEQQQGGQPTPTFKPANTTRNYVRHSRPGATRHGKDDVMARLLMGSGVQQSEAAALGRRVS